MNNLPTFIIQFPTESWETTTELVIRTTFGLTDFWVIIPSDDQGGHMEPITSWEPEKDFFSQIANDELRNRLKLLLEHESREAIPE